jgi:hypothetical protein
MNILQFFGRRKPEKSEKPTEKRPRTSNKYEDSRFNTEANELWEKSQQK